ncbi:MAG: hypothetical protein Tsb002_17950 [Wenzhouxiangellaceae bacterium]
MMQWLQTKPDISWAWVKGVVHRFAGVLGIVLLLAKLTPAMAQSSCDTDGSQRLLYEDFTLVDGWSLNGAAQGLNPAANSALWLTDNLRQSGSAFITEPVILRDATGFRASFSAAVQFRITDPQGISDQDGQGADGIVFVVQTVSNNVGGTGGGIGYQGIGRSLGVEFDSWNNGAQDQDSGNHLGINTNGSVVSQYLTPVSTRLNNGQLWYAWIDYDGASQLLEVRLAQSNSRPASASLSATLDLPAVLEQDSAFIGFTSGTGGAGGDHQIERFEFVNRYAPIDVCYSVDFLSTPSASVEAGNTYSYLAQAQDSNPGATVSYQLSSGPATMTLDTASGQLSWPVTNADAGLHPVTLTALSSSGLSTTQTFQINVLTVANSEPQIVSSPLTVTEADAVYEYAVVASDADNDPLTYSLQASPPGMTIDAASGLIHWQSQHADRAAHPVTIHVSDDAGGSASQSFELLVIDNDGGNGNFGTDFWVMVNYNPVQAKYGELLVVSDQATSGQVVLAGVRSLIDFEVIPGQVTRLRLPLENNANDTFNSEFTELKAAHITSDAPVGVFVVNHGVWSSDAYLALPTFALGQDYQVTVPGTGAGNDWGSSFAIIATEPGTVVTITPSQEVTHPSSTSITRPAGVPFDIELPRAGELFSISSYWGRNYTGSTISANKRVAVLALHHCANIPAASEPCDTLNEQMLPRRKWGQSYYSVPVATRFNGDAFRIFAIEDNTQVTLDGSPLISLDQGAFHDLVLTAAAEISADQPISVQQYAHSSEYDGALREAAAPGSLDFADPFMLQLTPQAQWRDRYVFATGTTEYLRHFVNVVIPASARGSLRIDGQVVTASWQAIAASGMEGAAIELTQGSHEITAAAPFALYSYGFGRWISYGYAAGTNLIELGPSVVIQSTALQSSQHVGEDACYQGVVQDSGGAPLAQARLQAYSQGVSWQQAVLETDDSGGYQWCFSSTALGQDEVVFSHGDGEARHALSWEQPLDGQTPPRFVSNPGPLLYDWDLGYTYEPEVFDPDAGATLTFTLQDTTNLARVDSVSGVVTVAPNIVIPVQMQVTLTVTDNSGLNASQTVMIETASGVGVSGIPGNRLPRILNTPPQQVVMGQSYSFELLADDVDGQSLSYTFDHYLMGDPCCSASAGIPVLREGNRFTVKPISKQLSDVMIVDFQVSDGQVTMSEWAEVELLDNPAANTPPQIDSASQLPQATVGVPYQFTLQASDADGDSLWYQLKDLNSIHPGPLSGMTFGDSLGRQLSGEIDWPNPPPSMAGEQDLRLIVADGRGGVAEKDFTLPVFDPNNSPPVITSTPPLYAKVGVRYTYFVGGSDADGNTLSVQLVEAPASTQVQSLRIIRWTPTAAEIGDVPFRITLSDGIVGAPQQWSVHVAPADEALAIGVTASPDFIEPGEAVTISLDPQGVSGNATITANVDGQPLTLDSNLQAVINPTQPGLHTVTANLSSSQGTVSNSVTFVVRDISDTTPPLVTIDNIVDLAEITAPEAVIGSVSDANLVSWILAVFRKGGDNSQFTTLAEGVNVFSQQNIGQFDPTLLRNGMYNLVLQATDTGGNTSFDSRTLRVSGDLKVGDFSITFEDLSVNVGGIPVVVTRTYDSRRRHEDLDFGHGWSIDYQNMDVQESRTVGFSWQLNEYQFGQTSTWCVEPNGNPVVSVTMPDGEVESFIAKATPECTPIAPELNVQLSFEPIDGADSQLEVMDVGLIRLIDGNLADPGAPGDPINPNLYRLTTAEGFVFELNQGFTINRVIEPNGNSLTYTQNGIEHSQGFSLQFVRDADGRITEIIAPDGSLLSYGYDVDGNLISSADPTNHTTQYTYVDGWPHLLEDILDPRGVRASRSEYDADGRLTAMIDADGQRVELQHDIVGRTETIRDRRGNLTVYVYDDEGNILAETNALNETIIRTYDSDRNQLSETNALNQTTSWTYDARGNQLSETDPLLRISTFTYNSRNQLLTQTDASQTVTVTNTYDANNGNLLTMTDALQNTTTFHWDSGGGTCSTGASTGQTDALNQHSWVQPLCFGPFAGLPQWQEDVNGTRTTFTYDTMGRVLSETTQRTDENGVMRDLIRQYEYDAAGRVITVTDPMGNISRTEYNAMGKQSATIDALLRRTEYEYDARGNLIKTTYPDNSTEHQAYDTAGNLSSETDRFGKVTRYVYDALNRQVEVILPDDTPATDSDNPRTLSEYDAAGRLTATVDANGNRTNYEYDAAGREVKTIDALLNETVFEYNNRDQRTAVVDARLNRTEFEYDAAGRLIKTIFPDLSEIKTTYDALGRKVAERAQDGAVTSFEYDALGNLTAVVDPLLQRTEYDYDEQSNKTIQRDALLRETKWTYDDLGRATSRILPLGQVETMAYDAVGNFVSRLDFNGHTTNLTYDSRNRIKTKTYIGVSGQNESWNYGTTFNSLTRQGPGEWRTFQYDAQGRMIRDIDGSDRIDYTYDAHGNVLSRTYILNSVSRSDSYSYDALNRLATVIHHDGGVTSYGYDANGNRQTVTYPNGVVTEYQYDALNRLTQLQTRDSVGNVLQQFDYTLDAAGRRTRIGELGGRYTEYVYDAAGRLTDETVSDLLNGNYSAHYVYDAVGNRTSSTIDGVTASYSYDANDRLISNGAWQYEYDANGNTLREHAGGDEKVYSYNRANRLIAATVTISGVSETKTFEYDNAGIRVSSRDNSNNITEYLIDRNRDYAQVIIEDAPSGITAYSYGDDLLSQNRGGTVNYYHYDGLGSTRALSDNSGALTDNYAYEAFGTLLNQSGATSNDYLYTGEQYDSDLSQYYLRARYYYPHTARFTQMDSWKGRVCFTITLNKYIYANTDPVNGIDPSGNEALTGQMGGLHGFGILAAIAAPSYAKYLIGGSAVAMLVMVSNENTSWTIAESTISPNINSETDRVAYEGNRREYKNRCGEQWPGGGTQCDKWRWELRRNRDCADMREEFARRWFGGTDGGHQIAVDEMRRAADKLESKIDRLCRR